MPPVGNPNMKVGMPSVNPKGRPSGVFHTLSDKRDHFLTTLTRGQIIEIVKDANKLDEYTAFEAQVLIGLSEALMETPIEKLDPSKERDRMYDRELGKAKQAITGGDEGDAPLKISIVRFTEKD